MDPLLEALSVHDIARTFGSATLSRARPLQRMVEITKISPGKDRVVITGSVEGTHVYQTMVSLAPQAAGVRIVGSCSCPVTNQCKHAAAMISVVQQEVTVARANGADLELGLWAKRGNAGREGAEVQELPGAGSPQAQAALAAGSAASEQRGWEQLVRDSGVNVIPPEEDLNFAAGQFWQRGLPGQGGTFAARRPAWESEVQELVTELGSLGSRQRRNEVPAAMALRLELDPTPPRYGGTLAVTARAMKEGKKRGWIKTGAAWGDVCSPWGRGGLVENQRAALERFADALGGASSASQPRSLESASPRIWSALEAAVEAGVELQGGDHLQSLEVAPDKARIVVRIDREAPGDHRGAGKDTAQASAATAVRLAVQFRDEEFWGVDVVPLGREAHGVLLLLPAEAPSLKRGVFARFETQLNDRLTYLLRVGRSTAVPAEGRAELEENVVPRLARVATVATQDPTLRAAIPLPPQLVARVNWWPGAAELEFLFRYRSGAHEDVVPAGDAVPRPGAAAPGSHAAASAALVDYLGADGAGRAMGGRAVSGAQAPGAGTRPPASGTITRDQRAEAALLNAAAPGPATTQLLAPLGGFPARARVEGAALVGFVERVLPELRRDFELLEHGAAPVLRRLEREPEIRFEVAEESPGGVDWLDLRVEISVGEEKVPLPEVLAALTLGEPVVLLPSGAYVDAQHPALARLARMVSEARDLRRSKSNPDTVRVGAADAEWWTAVDRLGETDGTAAAWIERARTLRAPERMPEVEPVGIVTELRDYQRAGVNWLHYLYASGLGGILADDMGLGKTLQVLSLISLARADGGGPFLVVAPTSVVGAWKRQAATHAPGLRVATVMNTARRRGVGLDALAAENDVVVTSYTLLRSEAEGYAEVAWGGLVLDEAQAIKNAASKTFQAVRKIHAPFSLAVTGTPVENRIGELWPLLAVVAPGLYPTLESFTRLVVTPVEKHENLEAMARLRARVRPFLLRRTKDLVASALPPKTEEVLPVTLGKAHRHFYDAILQRERQQVLGLVEAEGEGSRVEVFAALTRLRLASLHAGLVDEEHAALESAKIAELVPRLVELAAEGHRALVFSQFTSFLGLIREAVEAPGLPVVYLDGSTRDRGAVLEEFAAGESPVFLISLKAGGVGLTLTEADYVFIMDPWWNPAVEAQAVDRAHRIGQERPVMVYRLVSADTIEEKVMVLKERKAELFDQVVGTAQSTPSALTDADLRELLGG